MRPIRTGRIVWILVLLAGLPLQALATSGSNGGAGGGSSLMLNSALSVDAADDRDAQLGANWAVSAATTLSFLSEYTSSPADRTDLVTHTLGLGVDQQFTSSLGGGLFYQHWGKPGDIMSNSYYANLYWQNTAWQVTVLPGFRRITLNTRSNPFVSIKLPNNVEFDDRRLGLRIDYTGLDNWLFEASTTRHDYTRNPSVLNRRTALLFFTGSALTLSQGFLSHSSTFRVERDFGLTSLAMDYEIDRSAIDGTYAYTTDLDFETPISERFDMEIITGVTRAAHTPQTGFVTFNLVYYR